MLAAGFAGDSDLSEVVLWDLDTGFLESAPENALLIDRLRVEGKLPEQPEWRRWLENVLSAYRAVEPQEHWWHLPDGQTLRVKVELPGREVTKAAGVGTATRIMADNHYGWFERVARGIYALTETGRKALSGGGKTG